MPIIPRKSIFILKYTGLWLLAAVMPGLRLAAQVSGMISPRDSAEVYVFYNNIQGISSPGFKRMDSTTFNIHSYDPLLKSEQFYAGLGNIGQPAVSRTPGFVPARGFAFGRDALNMYRFDPQNLPYYLSASPWSEIRYVMGPDKENFLQATYNRNVYKGLNVGLFYRLINSTGPYSRQKTDMDNTGLSLRYFARDGHYGLMAAYIRNGFDFQQNGGLVNDDAFESNTEARRAVIPVRLTAAQTQEYGNIFSVTQFWEPGFSRRGKQKSTKVVEIFPDSVIAPLPADTLPPIPEKRSALMLGRFSHTLSFSRDAYTYSDANPMAGFYPVVLRDSTKTFDSTTVTRFENELSWTNSLFLYSREFPVIFRFSARHLLASYTTDSTLVRRFQQWIPSADIRLVFPAGISLSGSAFYVYGDYNGGDMGLQGRLGKTTGHSLNWELGGQAGFFSTKPAYVFQRYKGNHQQWENDFQRQDLLMLGGFLTGRSTEIRPEYILISRMVYMGEDALPRQRDNAFSMFRLWLSHHQKAGRWNFSGTLVMQKASDTLSLRLPEIICRGTISLTAALFNHALHVEPGISASWNTSHFADNYMPSLNAFYLQSAKAVGNFVMADVFLNMKVARARLFLRYRHINSGWNGYQYYGAPTYPYPDGGLNFGVIWPFYD